MKQDILHIRDAVSKTFTINPSFITVETDFDEDSIIVPNKYRESLMQMLEFSYNRADDFKESTHGVYVNISGSQYAKELGDIAQNIYEAVKA